MSDVCSSDLGTADRRPFHDRESGLGQPGDRADDGHGQHHRAAAQQPQAYGAAGAAAGLGAVGGRSGSRGGGHEGGPVPELRPRSWARSWGLPPTYRTPGDATTPGANVTRSNPGAPQPTAP